MTPDKYLIVVGGPTASGKTGLAIQLAKHFQTEIISADSRQFYEELEIGTAKPNKEELSQAKHHFVDSLSIFDNYSVGDFERDALIRLKELFEDHQVVILAGGSGLYINALCKGLDVFPQVPESIRKNLEVIHEKEGIVALQKLLKEVDPVYYEKVDLQNPHRLIRALSIYQISGQPYSSFLNKGKNSRPFKSIYLQLHWDRTILYQRINQRVDLMISRGLIEEARRFLPQENLSSLQTVGYQELFPYFKENTSKEEAIDLIKRNSRRYAKRQLTWMRRDGFWKHFNAGDFDKIITYLEFMRKDSYELETQKLEEEVYQFGFNKNGEALNRIKLSRFKKIELAAFEKTGSTEADYWLIHELKYRVGEEVLWLISPKEKELFLEKNGFDLIENLSKLPLPVKRKLEQSGDWACFRTQKL